VKLKINFNRVGGSHKPYNKAKKIVFKARASEKVIGIKAVLRVTNAKGKIVGTGSLAKMDGKGVITVKLTAKLKKSKYFLVVTGRNAKGQFGQVTAILNLK